MVAEGQDRPLGFGMVTLLSIKSPGSWAHPLCPVPISPWRVGTGMWMIPQAWCSGWGCRVRGLLGSVGCRGLWAAGVCGQPQQSRGGLGAAELARVLSAREQ